MICCAGIGWGVAQALGRYPTLGYKLQWTSPSLNSPVPFKFAMPTVSKASEPLLETAANTTITGFRNGVELIAKNGEKILMPPRESMTTEEAADWLANMGEEMPHLIDARMKEQIDSPVDRAAFAKYLENGFKIVQRNAMHDQKDLIDLNIASPITSLIQDTDKFGKTSGGKEMYERIAKNAQSGMFNTQKKLAEYREKIKPKSTCFVAGTLVWTDKGKVPIEQLKVGDMVLSKHESNTGEQAYKPVTRTFVHEDEVISLFRARSETVPNTAPGASSGPIAEKFKKYSIWNHFICVTPNHPFYVEKKSPFLLNSPNNIPDQGWTEAQYLYETCPVKVQIADGSYINAHSVRDFHKTDEATIGWAPREGAWSSDGYYFDTNPDCLAEVSLPADSRDSPTLYETEYYTPMRATVYNIEVADFHTYYVGDLGFWVHNKNDPFDNRVLADVQAKALKGDDAGRIFYVIEKPVRSDPAGLFETQTQGFYQLEGKVIPPAIEYRKPFSRGDNYITSDSLALMPNGKPSAMLMDAKQGTSTYVNDTYTQIKPTKTNDLALKLAQISEAVKQSKKRSQVSHYYV